VKLFDHKILKELSEEKEAVLITEHGMPSAYLVDLARQQKNQVASPSNLHRKPITGS